MTQLLTLFFSLIWIQIFRMKNEVFLNSKYLVALEMRAQLKSQARFLNRKNKLEIEGIDEERRTRRKQKTRTENL